MPFPFPPKFMHALNSIHATSQVKDTVSAPTTGVQAIYPPSMELWEGREGRLGRDWGGERGRGRSPGHQVEWPGPITNDMWVSRKAEASELGPWARRPQRAGGGQEGGGGGVYQP